MQGNYSMLAPGIRRACGLVYALDANDGSIQWKSNIVVDSPPSPPGFDGERARLEGKPARPRIAACDGKTLYQPIFDQSRVVALDCKTGTTIWSFQAGGWIYGNPAVAEKYVLVGSQDKRMNCVDKDTGEVKWKYLTGSRVEAPAAVHNGSAYFGACDGTVYRVNLDDGAEQWSFRCDPYDTGRLTAIYAAPLVSENAICIGAMEGQVYILDTEDGALRWKFRPSHGSEIVSITASGNWIYVVTRTADSRGEHAVIALHDAG
jgi:outer membrane protein assembly factor BamB